jgi:hypothetical protein
MGVIFAVTGVEGAAPEGVTKLFACRTTWAGEFGTVKVWVDERLLRVLAAATGCSATSTRLALPAVTAVIFEPNA